ncbi:unnamed protein product [Cuscuta epithymum]|uniref:Uncharacterized protein n=1 Tax=Cuscuta epithymum TaxID=186058 RepID=A0AAV0FNK3_9ASTE|nr:unnamed protein product [Cuscuta epithymum]
MTIGTKVPGSVRNRRWTPEIEKEGFAGEEAQVLARLSDHFHAGGGETTVAQTAADDRRRSTPLSCTCRPPDKHQVNCELRNHFCELKNNSIYEDGFNAPSPLSNMCTYAYLSIDRVHAI